MRPRALISAEAKKSPIKDISNFQVKTWGHQLHSDGPDH